MWGEQSAINAKNHYDYSFNCLLGFQWINASIIINCYKNVGTVCRDELEIRWLKEIFGRQIQHKACCVRNVLTTLLSELSLSETKKKESFRLIFLFLYFSVFVSVACFHAWKTHLWSINHIMLSWMGNRFRVREINQLLIDM